MGFTRLDIKVSVTFIVVIAFLTYKLVAESTGRRWIFGRQQQGHTFGGWVE